MNKIGTYQNRKVYYSDYKNLINGNMPNGNWICFAISNIEPNSDDFETFVRASIKNDILEFKSCGTWGEKLHDWFDEIASIMESMENHPEIETMTTWHNNESIADVFWQCFFATCIPEHADFDNLKIICTDLENVNRIEELKDYISRFENGWLPKE